jgi:hypothetical protein
MSGDDRSDSPADGVIDLVRFFRALRPEARREFEALAAKDREFGEDVAAERAAADASAAADAARARADKPTGKGGT